jgi:hypothetical protein
MSRDDERKRERERADGIRLLRGWFAWHRDERDAVLAGPHSAILERLLYILKNLTPQPTLPRAGAAHSKDFWHDRSSTLRLMFD